MSALVAQADFKTLLLRYKMMKVLAPSYLSELLTPNIPPSPQCSLNFHLLVIPLVNN